MDKSKVSIVKCGTYDTKEVEAAVKRAVDLLGGIEKFIKPGSRVLIKPNILSARPPEEGVDTHPEMVRAVARLVKTVTPNIVVGDSPGGWSLREIDTIYEKSGIRAVCAQEGLRLARFDKVVEMGGFPITAVFKEVDAVISIPKLKTHTITVLTGAVKNMFGMVVGLYKAQCHLAAPTPEELVRVLVRVFKLVKPALSIMDGVVGMEGDGPSGGSLRNTGLILASPDAVAMDAVFAKLAGLEPTHVPLIQEAIRKGCGAGDLAEIDVLGEKIEDAAIKNFKMPKTFRMFYMPWTLVRIGVRAIKFYPHVSKKKCKKCGLCADICPKAAVIKTRGGGFKIVTKNCIYCLCCHEVCPHKAIDLRKSLLAKLFMR